MRKDLIRTSLAGVATATLLATGALAQTNDWAGLYGGAVIGFGQIHNDLEHVDTGPGGGGGGPSDVDADGLAAGGVLGFNWVNGDYVYGVEGDFLASRLEGSATGGGGGTHTIDIDQIYTLRGRAGMVIDDRQTLLYGTAGLAGQSATLIHSGGGEPDWKADYLGWTAGIGVERRLPTGARIGAELLYLDFGTESTVHTPMGGPMAGVPHLVTNSPDGPMIRFKAVFPL